MLGSVGASREGATYLAYDPELDRRVTLEVLDASTGPGGRPESGDLRAAMLRTVGVLARLRHPDVVTVHDVGELGHAVWIATDSVEGHPFDAWCDGGRRSWRDVLQALLPVARGLASLHDRGLAHGDVRPATVVVRRDGRARLVGLGAAVCRAAAGAEDAGGRGAHPGPAMDTGDASDDPVPTPSARTAGPPAAGPAADQWSWCKMVWRPLYGVREVGGTALASDDVGRPMHHGSTQAAGGPGWLRRILARGLDPEPARRFPSMHALVAALERGRARARMRRVAAVVGIASVVLASAWGVRELERRRRVAACEAAAASFDDAWNPGVRGRLARALVASGVPYGEATATRVLPWLDDYAARWRRVRFDTCVAASVDGPSSEVDSRRADACLDARRIRFETLVEHLSTGDPRVAEKGVEAAVSLPGIDVCGHPGAMAEMAPDVVLDAAEFRAMERQLARAQVLLDTGHYDEGKALVATLEAPARDLGYAPSSAALARLRARFEEKTGKFAVAERHYEDAFFRAAVAGADAIAFAAAEDLAFMLGVELHRVRDGMRWSDVAETFLERLGSDVAVRTARHHHVRGTIRAVTGDFDAAEAEFLRAVELRERTLGTGHPDLASTLNNLAGVYFHTGDVERAQEVLERAVASTERALGPDHPEVAKSLSNLVEVARRRGDLPYAHRLARRTLAIARSALGPDHPQLALALANLAGVEAEMGQTQPATEHFERALAIRLETLGPDHPEVARLHAALAEIRRLEGDLEGARRGFERALAAFERSAGPDHPDLAVPLVGLAEVELGAGRGRRAIALAERALALLDQAGAPAYDGAEARFVLARALWAVGADRERARALARAARDGFGGPTAADHAARDEIAAWLEAHERGAGDPEARGR